jgi:hypothetical protein
MADYKGIKGFKVQYLSADPSDPIIGQTWYNDTSKDLKYTGFATQLLGQLVEVYQLQGRLDFIRSRNTNSSFSLCWWSTATYCSSN